MSRHVIMGRTPEHVSVVGWDNPMQTFYAQVYGRFDATKEEQEDPILWVGTTWEELTSVDALQAVIAPYVTLTPQMRLRLGAEYAARTEPTALQQRAKQLSAIMQLQRLWGLEGKEAASN